MKDLLNAKIEELKGVINENTERLKEVKQSSMRTYECYYYDRFAETYAELNKLQFALDILEELLDDIEDAE